MELIDNNIAKSQLKETEVGLLPTDWEVNQLSHYFSYISYGFTNPMPTVSDGVFMITANDIKNGKINYETARNTSDEAYNNFISDKSRPKVNDILLTKDGTLGRLAVVDEVKICINQSVAVIRPNGKVDPTFLKILLESSHYQRTMIENAGGSTIKHIYITIVDKMKIGVPPTIEEQKAIASTLSDTDALIAGLKKLIAKKKAIKQGAMQQLLTPPHKGGKRLPGFSGDWEKYKFDFLFQKVSSKEHQISSAEYNSTGKYPVVDQGQKYVVGYTEISEKVFTVPKNGIIVFGDHTREIKFVEFDFVVGADGTQLLLAKEMALTKFLYYLLLMKEIPNTGYNRHFKFLKEFDLEIPKLEEQLSITSILSDMDKEIEALESKKAKYEQLKQGMMQELLTGKTRLL
ncbi:restriction endonuclease subunit S [Salinimicrobium sp. WS361]|uniref:restriction endonuclease subunit S n=1 Tax=Salinimicrobium sp. WS361 TaxID=3425123 RepID=UPI003D6E64CD